VRLVFDPAASTPDLAQAGPVEAVVAAVRHDAQAGGPLVEGTVHGPPLLKGFALRAWARYEDEPLEACLAGGAPTVNASIEAADGRAVAGGLATLSVAGPDPHAGSA
jgi:hypothetical protein